MNFKDKLEKAIQTNNSLLCVGLDPDFEKIGSSSLFDFNKKIIDATASSVCAYKPNIAFYEATGAQGVNQLKKTIDYIKSYCPDIPVICDAKRGDVPTSSAKYVQEVFDYFGADAITVNPLLGLDSLEPFLKKQDKGVFVLCRTSNDSAADFQDLQVGTQPLYLVIAQKVSEWSGDYPNIAVVVGATWPEELTKVREILPSTEILIPGVGAQGGSLEEILKAGLKKDKTGLIISASRSIIYSQDPKAAAKQLKDEIENYRKI